MARHDFSATPVYVWALGFVVMLLALTVCGLWALYLLRGQLAFDGPTPAPIIWTVTPSPLIGGTEGGGGTGRGATPPPTPTASAGIAIGRYVRVVGTGGYGLNLREGPGENYPRADVALEGEVFIVADGPAGSGGSQWWKIRDPANEVREWWAVGDFLAPVEHP